MVLYNEFSYCFNQHITDKLDTEREVFLKEDEQFPKMTKHLYHQCGREKVSNFSRIVLAKVELQFDVS